MYSDWQANFIVALSTFAAICLCVLLHYEGLLFTSRRLTKMGGPPRIKVLYAIVSVLTMHCAEIWIFGLTFWLLAQVPGCGQLGPGPLHLFDYIYFSAATYTTVGFGDLAPTGPVRFIAGIEGLAGLVLITWSASFTYLEMERYWRRS
jgi:hypothetical protein